MAYIKLDISKTNYQLRTTGGEKYTEVFINTDNIAGFCTKEIMTKPGVYRDVPLASVTATAQYRMQHQCIEEPTYDYEYYIMTADKSWSVSKECYERVKEILTEKIEN